MAVAVNAELVGCIINVSVITDMRGAMYSQSFLKNIEK